MKAENVIATIERFFLDIIGTLLPGSVLIGGIWLILDRSTFVLFGFPPADGGNWSFFLATSYILGHFIASANRLVELVVGRTADFIRSRLGSLRKVLVHVRSSKALKKAVIEGPDYKNFVDKAVKYFPLIKEGESSSFHPARNIAISLASPQEEGRVFRFMFLGLLNSGVATAILLVLTAWTLLGSLAAGGLELVSVVPLGEEWPWAVVWALLALPFIERGFYFNSIAMRVPFSMGTAALQREALESPGDADGRALREVNNSPNAVYLAGGFRSGWQDRVEEAWKGRVIDPRAHRLERKEEYTLWDLEAIRACDWVVAYLEATNPGGYALALEIGFAKALGKRVILVDEKSEADENEGRYLAMLHATADLVFVKFEDALDFLRSCDFHGEGREE